jgi:hypothetical protein
MSGSGRNADPSGLTGIDPPKVHESGQLKNLGVKVRATALQPG